MEASAASLASLHRFLLFAVGDFLRPAAVDRPRIGRGAVLVDHRTGPQSGPRARADRGWNFGEHVDIPNRDEFGRLAVNLDRTSDQLSELYTDLSTLNADLEKKVDDQLDRLHRTEQLRRYLAPQVADAVLEGGATVSMTSTRRNLTILFANVRGFTSLSERLEPEELIEG